MSDLGPGGRGSKLWLDVTPAEYDAPPMTLFSALPDRVSIYEVSPRTGLQNEAVTVPTTRKLRLLEALAQSGLRRIEATSFVSPRWVPQLADGDEVAARLPPFEGMR